MRRGHDEDPISERILAALRLHPEGIDIISLRQELELDTTEHQHFDRRLRDLRKKYLIPGRYVGSHYCYFLKGERPISLDDQGVDQTTRARILHRDSSRCQMCGKTVVADNVRLQIDHRIPRDWGGDSQDDNLQALCTACNLGKRNFFASITDPATRQALQQESIHKRIGELLRLKAGEYVEKDLLQIVAHTHEDWEKRMRELRLIGWDYEVQKYKANGRIKTRFRLLHAEPWADDPGAAIREAERERGARR